MILKLRFLLLHNILTFVYFHFLDNTVYYDLALNIKEC